MTDETWHSMDKQQVLKKLDTDNEGLTEAEAEERLEKYGLNKLEETGGVSPLSLLLDQFKSILVIILIIAAGISTYVSWMKGEAFTDTYVIIAILAINAALGFFQEYRAEKAIEELKKMIKDTVSVIRDDEEMAIESQNLVPGDIIILSAGDSVPADARIIEAYNLNVNEAVLTGESTPISKETTPVDEDLAPEERNNMLYMGTDVGSGKGRAVVVNTGMDTEFGKIAGMVQTIERGEAPLKKDMEEMGRRLAIISVILTIWIFGVGVIVHKREILEVFLTAVSMAVSAIPEGLPAVLTITLALGVSKMAEHKAIVRKLASVETLGSTTVICSDKTGTITKNEMTLKEIALPKRKISITGTGYFPEGEFYEDGEKINEKDERLLKILKAGVLCNDTNISEVDGERKVLGDPTEAALLVAGEKADIYRDDLGEEYELIQEYPFEAQRKMMSVVYNHPENGIKAYVKGAPEVILDRSSHILTDEGKTIFDEDKKDEIKKTVDEMAADALRLLAIGYKDITTGEEFNQEQVENDLVFLGLTGMIDPPREEINEAIETARGAGIRTVMVTGDYRITAVAIARDVGILEEKEDNSVYVGEEVNQMTDEELDSVIEDARVFARVSPENKVKIAESLRRKGHIVAMTGDGVNDAPAIKTANIGVAMGIKGSDVSREAADMVLEDDNYATIVRAIKGGRRLYDNVTKYVRLMLSANFDEFFVITAALTLGLPLPLLPIHVLWVNLVTDGLPAVALSVDPAAPNIMKYPPRDPEEGLLDRFWKFILVASLVSFAMVFIGYYMTYQVTRDTNVARTVALTSVVFYELILAYQTRSETKHVFQQGLGGITNNHLLFISVIASLLLQLAVIYISPLNTIFHLSPLSPRQLGTCILAGLSALFIMPSWLIERRWYKPEEEQKEHLRE